MTVPGVGGGTGSSLAADLAAESDQLKREVDEIALLLRQVKTEAERHEARRQQTAERFEALLNEGGAGAQLREAHAQLLLQAQRTVMMDAQVEVLEGKLKILQRFGAHLAATLALVRAGGADGGRAGAGAGDPRAELASQEEMRRQIARQMHDGPAQSIANIALQAEVVQRLLLSDRAAGELELGQLRQMVQHALEATKNFIFDVRPMVLDDLGLVPTLRRVSADRARRTDHAIRFESVGADRRLGPELESALFRIVDDAVSGFIEADAEEISVRLNWTADELTISVSTYDGTPAPGPEPAPTKPGEPLPPALAAMIEEQRHRERAKSLSNLPEESYGAILTRAATVAVAVSLVDDGRTLSIVVGLG